MDFYQKLLIVCPLVFFAGFVDSIAGGGGIISLPAYYAVGVPPHMALGTNKFSSTFGAFIATTRFIKSKNFHQKAAIISVITALIGSAFGAKLASVLSAKILQYTLIVMLPIMTIFILKNKKLNNDGFAESLPINKILFLAGFTGFIIGGYDGFFGPGTGTFLILIFNTIIGFDILTSSGNAKIVNLSSNLAALITFLINGNVDILLAIPCALFSVAGSYVGSGIALKNGIKIIKPIFVLVLALLLLKVLFDILK